MDRPADQHPGGWSIEQRDLSQVTQAATSERGVCVQNTKPTERVQRVVCLTFNCLMSKRAENTGLCLITSSGLDLWRSCESLTPRPSPCLAVMMVHSSDLRLVLPPLFFTLVMLAFSLLSLPTLGPKGGQGMGHVQVQNVTLLVWWLPFSEGVAQTDCAVSFGIPGCLVTADRQEFERVDAVIIHHRELVRNRAELLGRLRPAAQKWIWMNFESPSHSGDLGGFEGVFNLTMSYRAGSDIFLPYGYLSRRRVSGPLGVKSRRGFVAWVISNWGEEQERVQFFRRLRRHLIVDLYGRQFRPLINDSVMQTVSAYKFYLAFENSAHPDYITEKLWRNALAAGAVPVVLGPTRENYERFLPPNAFIHVDDFSTPQGLAAYLTHLHQNPALYRRHLEWRRDYSIHVTSFWEEPYCTACQAVRAWRHINRTVTDLQLWFQS